MIGDDLTFDEKCDQLRSWSKSLSNTVESTLPRIQAALDPATQLPPGCPSHASLALMEFSSIRKYFREVEAFVNIVDGAIRQLLPDESR